MKGTNSDISSVYMLKNVINEIKIPRHVKELKHLEGIYNFTNIELQTTLLK